MSTHLRPDLLRLVCAELPDHEAAFLRSLPADDVATHVAAYVAIRRLEVDLPGDLLRLFVVSLLSHLDGQMVQARGAAHSLPS